MNLKRLNVKTKSATFKVRGELYFKKNQCFVQIMKNILAIPVHNFVISYQITKSN